MNFEEAVSYIMSRLPMFTRLGAAAYKADLSNTINLAKALGNPEQGLRCLHIAGTNGKGSVCAFAASILQEAGYRTGLFTSPHFINFRERIRINGVMIPEDFVAGFIESHQPLFDRIVPSFFEMSFVLACAFFATEGTDIVVMETGMGGRLDSTNLVTPEVSVITNIGFDHMQFLGNTLPQIAAEKAGIIKTGIPVVIGEHHPETDPVFLEHARTRNASIYFATDHFEITDSVYHPEENLLCASLRKNATGAFMAIESPLAAEYQLKNIATTVQAVDLLIKAGLQIFESHIKNGIRKVIQNTGIRGRWQVLGNNPLVVADMAHNEPGISLMLQQVSKHSFRMLRIVLGMVSDKDSAKVLDLLPHTATYYFCRPDIPRGKDVEQLTAEARAKGLSGKAHESVKQALQAALADSSPLDMVLVTGSAFVVAEAI